jgi:hypothetical protein
MWACYLQSLAIAFNFAITPFFWLFLAPIIFADADWHGLGLVQNLHLVFVHTIPLLASLANVYYTRGFVMLPRDAYSVLVLGVLYIPANYIGA